MRLTAVVGGYRAGQAPGRSRALALLPAAGGEKGLGSSGRMRLTVRPSAASARARALGGGVRLPGLLLRVKDLGNPKRMRPTLAAQPAARYACLPRSVCPTAQVVPPGPSSRARRLAAHRRPPPLVGAPFAAAQSSAAFLERQ